MVYQWRHFLLGYPDLYPLVWVHCYPDCRCRKVHLPTTGFRSENSRIQPLSIIRTPLGRNEIIQVVQSLYTGSSKDFQRLEFFLEPPGTVIAKTIIYIDSKNAVLNARRYLVSRLIDMGYDAVHAKPTSSVCMQSLRSSIQCIISGGSLYPWAWA